MLYHSEAKVPAIFINKVRKKSSVFFLLSELLLYCMKQSKSSLDFFKLRPQSSELPRHSQEQFTISDAVIWCGAWQDLPWKREGVQMRQKHWLDCLNWETWVTLFSLLNQENKAFWFLVYYYSDKSQGVLRFKISWVAEQYSQFTLWILCMLERMLKDLRGRLKDSSPSETPALIWMVHFLWLLKSYAYFVFGCMFKKKKCYVGCIATWTFWVWLSLEIWRLYGGRGRKRCK